jgi:hypothetical protein
MRATCGLVCAAVSLLVGGCTGDQTRAGISRALRPWAGKVFRITRSITAEDVVSRLDLSQ